MKPGRMRAKALGVGADAEPQGVGAREKRGITKQKIETGCVSVFARRYSHQSVQYIRGLNRKVNGLQQHLVV